MRVKSDVTREKIILSARKIISAKGMHETSIAMIAKDAKVSPTTIYSYFSGKQSLFDATGVDDSMQDYHPSKLQKKREIIEAAILSFGKKGYERTSIESVMRKVGMGKTAFYQFFESKEALFSAVHDESLVNLTSHALEVNHGTSSWIDILRDIGQAYLIMGNDEKRKAIFKTVVEQSEVNPDFGRIYHESGSRAVVMSICEGLKPFRDRGEIRDDIDLELAVFLFCKSIWAYNITYKYISGVRPDFSEESVIETALDIFFRGLQPAGSRSGRDI